jgi:hypothetical protein
VPSVACCLGVVIWVEAVVALLVLLAGSACLELVVAVVLGRPLVDDPSGSSSGVAGSCLVLLISWLVADWLFQELLAFQLADSGLLSVVALVGLGYRLHLAALGCCSFDGP